MKPPLHVIGSIIALIILMPPALSGQQVKPPEPPDPWLIRSQTITESLLKDAPALTSFDCAILFARLGDVWWKDDQERARSWMEKAIETVEYIPDQDPDDHSRRLATARTVLSIIAPHDDKLGRRVRDIIASSSARDSDKERNKNADALVEEALAIVDRDPQRAALLGAESLRVGRSTILRSLLWSLRSRDPKLADALFMQALAVLGEKPDISFLTSLLMDAFPSLVSLEPSLPAPPDPLRSQLLLVVAAYFRNAMIAADSPATLCSSNAGFISVLSPLLPEFDSMLPLEQSISVRQLIVGCLPRLGPLAQEQAENAQRNSPLKTVDDFLAAADNARDTKVRTVLQSRAARLAAQQKNLERAIKIMDGMDDDARKFMEGTWEEFRWDLAVQAALDHLKHDDLAGVRRTIAAVPVGLRPSVQIGVAYELRAEESNRPLVTELIQTGREGLSKSDMEAVDKEGWSLSLLSLYAKFLPEESFVVLKETVTALNQKATGYSSYFNGRELVEPQTGYELPVSMLERDEFAFLSAVSSVESPAKRARIRLELLSASLDKHRTSKASRKATRQ